VQGYVLDLRSNPGGLLGRPSVRIRSPWLDEAFIRSPPATRDGIQDVKRGQRFGR